MSTPDDVLGQLRHRAALEHRPQRHIPLQRLLHARGDLRGQQRVPAQFEEVVLHAHPFDSQHFGPDCGQGGFQLIARRR